MGGGKSAGTGTGYPYPGTGTAISNKMDYLKKFTFTGVIQLIYRDNSTETSGTNTFKRETSTFAHRYKLEVNGYVYDPRLVLFTAGIIYGQEFADTKFRGAAIDYNTKNISYDLSAHFLPFRPVSLRVYALKRDSATNGSLKTSYDLHSISYGADFFFVKKGFPSIRLSYYHWESSSMTGSMIKRGRIIPDEEDEYFEEEEEEEEEPPSVTKQRLKNETKIDKYSLDVRGALNFINTTYGINGNFTKSSTNISNTEKVYNYHFLNLRFDTITRFRPQMSLAMSFNYSDFTDLKVTSLAAQLNLPTIGGLHHFYSYKYISSQSDTEDIQSHEIYNYLYYRFTNRLTGKVRLLYKTAKRDIFESDKRIENRYNVNFSVNYFRPIRSFDFSSQYIFTIGQDERQADYKFMYHYIGLKLSTRQWGFARLYLKYDFSYRTIEFTGLERSTDIVEPGETTQNADYFENVFTLGIQGKGPRRARWLVEGEARFFTSSGFQNAGWSSIYFGDRSTTLGQKNIQYTVRTNIAYPVFRRALLSFNGSYSTVKTDLEDADSENFESYYYEGRFKYSVLRNMIVSAYWKQEGYNKNWSQQTLFINGIEDSREITEYGLDLTYFWRRVFLYLEYTAYHTKQSWAQADTRQIYLILSRRF